MRHTQHIAIGSYFDYSRVGFCQGHRFAQNPNGLFDAFGAAGVFCGKFYGAVAQIGIGMFGAFFYTGISIPKIPGKLHLHVIVGAGLVVELNFIAGTNHIIGVDQNLGPGGHFIG